MGRKQDSVRSGWVKRGMSEQLNIQTLEKLCKQEACLLMKVTWDMKQDFNERKMQDQLEMCV